MACSGGMQQPYSNGNAHIPGNPSSSSFPDNSGFPTSPFQFNAPPYQDNAARSSQTSMQQHQPGGAGQPDGMFASSYPPGVGTSGPAGFDSGAHTHSTGLWRASSINSGGMTLAAELLGVPLPEEYSAKVQSPYSLCECTLRRIMSSSCRWIRDFLA